MAVATLPQTTCELRCLGPVTITGPSGVSLSMRTRKQVALLYYLARRPGRPVGRDQLIELLWSDDDEKAGRHSLSQSASLLNKAIGSEAIIAPGRDRMMLQPDVLWLDVTDFEQLASQGRPEEALRLWRGHLLEGVEVRRAPNFERWITEERERCLRLFRRMSHTRLDTLKNAGDYDTMRAESERLLEQDPLDETAMLSHLESLTLMDDRTLALRTYSEFERRLKSELDADPGPLLKGWVKRHRRGDVTVAPSSPSVALSRVSEITVLPAAQPLFGRTEEFATLWSAWDEAQKGKANFIIIEGEAGIGKTALATKLVNQAHVAGGSVVYVKCYKTEKSVPFAPITAIIRQLSRLPGFVALDPVWIGELTRLVPELRERYPNAPQPMAVDDAARHRLSDATSQAASAVADELPLMIVVDDLQDADEATLALLHYLGRSHLQYICFIASWRNGTQLLEYQRTFLDSAHATGFRRTLRLIGLGDKDAERLACNVAASYGTSLEASTIARVARHASGNPLHLIEEVLATISPGRAKRASEQSDTRSRGFGASARERYASLPQSSRLVAAIVETAGHPLSEFELAELSLLKPAELDQAIVALEAAQFGKRTGPRIGLVHEQYSTAISDATTTNDRREIHRRLATMLAAMAASNPAVRYEAARHFEAAGDDQAASVNARAAVVFAARLGAVRSEADALELLKRTERTTSYDLCVSLGQRYLSLGDFAKLEALCMELRASEIPPELIAELEYLELATALDTGRITLNKMYNRLRGLIESGVEFADRGPAAILLIRVSDKIGDYRLPRLVTRQLRRDARGNPDYRRFALIASGYVLCRYYQPARGVALFEEALAECQRCGDWTLECFARDCVAISLKQVGRFQDSMREFAFSLSLAQKTLNPHAEARCLGNVVVTEVSLGQLEAALARLDEADRTAGIAHSYHPWNTYNRAIVYMLMREYARAIQTFNRALDLARTDGVHLLAVDSNAGIALCALRLNQVREHRMHAQKALELEDPATTTRSGWVATAAAHWLRIVNGEAAISVLPSMLRAIKAARRQDAINCLQLEYEMVNMNEFYGGKRCTEERRQLAERAQRAGARYLASTCEDSEPWVATLRRDVPNAGD